MLRGFQVKGLSFGWSLVGTTVMEFFVIEMLSLSWGKPSGVFVSDSKNLSLQSIVRGSWVKKRCEYCLVCGEILPPIDKSVGWRPRPFTLVFTAKS